VHAIVMRRREVGEADRLLTLFTRPYGLLQVVAKGVRRIPSRRGGLLEPLSCVVALVSGRGGYYYLSAVEPYEMYGPLRADGECLSRAERLAGSILSFFGEEDAQPLLFDAFHEAMTAWPALPVSGQQVVEAALSMYVLRTAGVLPELRACFNCGAARPSEAVVLQAQHGGWACLSCHHSFAGTVYSLPPALLKVLRWLAVYPQRAGRLRLAEEDAKQLLLTVRCYMEEARSMLDPVRLSR
jgi:DNA repair protein RecO (recombination protein O)